MEEKSVEEEDPIQLLERLVDSSVQKQKGDYLSQFLLSIATSTVMVVAHFKGSWATFMLQLSCLDKITFGQIPP